MTGKLAGIKRGGLWISALAAVLLVGCAGSRTVTPAPAAVTAAPVDAPEHTVPPGFGEITFGTSYDEDTLLIDKPASRFGRSRNEIAYSAQFVRSVDATTVTIIIASRSTSGSERVIVSEEIDVSNPDADLFANALDLAGLVDNKAGSYVMRYVSEGDVLAEGEFTLLP